jgi:mannan endo-1,4-beta-mannosidase
MNKIIGTSIITISMLFISFEVQAQESTTLLVDAKATKQTKALFTNLQKLSKSSILFGHQHATEYGHGWSDEKDRSDVQSVVGSHPAVIGVDFSGLSGKPSSEMEATKKSLKNTIEATYQRGGITTVSWHFNNPVTNTAFYWKDSVSAAAVPMIIPGGSYHESYKQILQNIAAFVHSLHGKDGEAIPLIFRPFHEFDGDWFWWGASHCTKQEFTSLWKFTVQYLRDTLQVHNLLYAFSPDNKFTTEAQYLERYPGNNWVDMVGVDNYGDWGRDGKYNLGEGIKKLAIVSNYAIKNNKLAAFTETGLESIVKNDWYTSVLLQSLQSNALQLAYVLVWRNDKNSPTHYYAPFPGHASCTDFIKFYQSPFTLFEKDLPNLYK